MNASMGALTPKDKEAGASFRELEQKRGELNRLRNELAERELELSTRRAEQHAFERRYHQKVGAKYIELDEIKAQFLDMAAKLFPQSGEFRASAESAREHARHTAEEARESGADSPRDADANQFEPDENLRKLYRDVAKKIHPDLSTDPAERERRHHLMARLNKAYDERDAEKIRDVLCEWEENRPENDRATIGVQLVKVLRKISQARQRLVEIQNELARLEQTEVARLKEKVEQAEKQGRDILAEMTSEVDEKIEAMKYRIRRLAFDITQL